MKKIFLFLATALFALEGLAQTVFTVKDGEKTYSFPLTSEISVTDNALWVPDTIVLRDTLLQALEYKSRYKSVWFAKPKRTYNVDISRLRMRLVADSLWFIGWKPTAGEKVNFSPRNTDNGRKTNPASSGTTVGGTANDTIFGATGTAVKSNPVDWTMPATTADSLLIFFNENTLEYRVFGIAPDTIRDTVTLTPTYKTRMRLARINLDGTGYNNGTQILMKQVGDYKWSARIPGRAGHKFNFNLLVNLRDEPAPGFSTIPYFMYIGYAEAGKTQLTSAGTIYNINESGKKTAMFETSDFGTDSVEIIMLEDTAKYTTPGSRNLNGTYYVLSDNIINRTDSIIDTVTLASTYKTRVRDGYAYVNLDGSAENNGTLIRLTPIADYTWQAMIPGRAGHTLNFYFNLYSGDEPAPGYETISYYVHVGMALEGNTSMASAGKVYNKYATEGSTAKFQTADFGRDWVRLVFVEDSTAYYSKPNKNTYIDHGTYYILSDSIIGGREIIERHDTVSYYYYPLTVLSVADSMGSVKGSGVYRSGTSVEVSATANDGYDFENWSDGSTEAVRTFTVSGIDTLTAYFKKYEAPTTWTYNDMYLSVSNATTFMQEYQSMTKGSAVDTWEWEGTFDNDVTCSFYSAQSWSADYWGIGTWGDPYEENGTCKKSGGDMRIPAGTYKITFNVNRLTYTVTKE